MLNEKISIEEPDPVTRGINSLQLIFQSGRWWIATMTWDNETENKAIPPKYLHEHEDRSDIDEI
jgi:hypothetical protein